MTEPSAATFTLRQRLLVALVAPIVLLVAAGVLLYLQVDRLSQNAVWVDHTDAVIATTYDAQRQIVDQETAVRGYLLTNDARFLEPYHAVAPHKSLEHLAVLVVDNGEQAVRVGDIQKRYETWEREARRVLDGQAGAEARALPAMLERKRRMDEIRLSLGAILQLEHTLRDERAKGLADANRTTRWALIGLLGGAALLLGVVSRANLRAIADTFARTLEREREARDVMEGEQWVRAGRLKVNESVQGDVTVEELGRKVLAALAAYVGAEAGSFFASEVQGFRRRATYGVDREARGGDAFAPGDGVVGRAAESEAPLVVRDVPADALRIRSGLADARPAQLVLVPARSDGSTHAVVELAFLREPTPRALELLDEIGEAIAVALRSAEYKLRLKDLLEESQRQAEELQTQQEELRVANEELEEQSNALREAQRQLEERQDELEATNAALESHTLDLQHAKTDLEDKAAELARASRYKSEFLANMSHELRTPLNSSLILAKLLADNKDQNLSSEQVRFAETIYNAGNDLLVLINDILDLSKIEAGKMDVVVESATMPRLVDSLRRTFDAQAKDKGLTFGVELAEGLPPAIETDVHRAQQVLKNLLSNAFKFTEKGSVTLRIAPAPNGGVAFHVTDTGIGIPPHQQDVVFEAFRQADGTTNRKYGGTGLGLSISRDLARMLGGDLALESELGVGSTFTLVLPRAYQGPAEASAPGAAHAESARRARPVRTPAPPSVATRAAPARVAKVKPPVPDDRDGLETGRRLLLVVEDDTDFTRILVDLAHELDFQCLVADTADEGVRLASIHAPTAIVLDMGLPDHSGLSVLDRLKRNPRTRHVPVHVVSGADYTQQALAMGAAGYMLKPVKREELVAALARIEARFSGVRRLLIVEDDDVQRDSLGLLLGGSGVETVGVGTVKEALAHLRTSTFDCVVTDLSLPGESGFDLLSRMSEDEDCAFPPVIVYTGRSLSDDEEQLLRKHSSSIIVKGARSPERLLDEVTLFLHQVEAELPAERQRMLKQARDREKAFAGRTILVVEDDVRNVFALSSLLEPKGANVLIARNGKEGLAMLQKHAEVDLVLMDIMMPEMDGLEATRAIRKNPAWAKLPVLALTAKAMRDDQEKCLAAGANDYVAKPLDVELLLSLLRVWMPQ